MPKSKFYILGLLTLIGFPLIGITIVGIVEEFPREFTLSYEESLLMQILTGTGYGLIAAFVAWRIIRIPFMQSVRVKYGALIKQLRLNLFDIIFISICAGVGEELLFRGVIQPYLGVWITAVIFVAIHGYLNPMNQKMTIYGVYLTIVIGGLGYLSNDIGIVTAIVAHTVMAIVLLLYINASDIHETD